MSGNFPERLDPASRVPAVQADESWPQEQQRKRHPRKPLLHSQGTDPVEVPAETSHNFDDLA